MLVMTTKTTGHNTNQSSLGKYLRHSRKEKGSSPYWSMESVAKRAGITRNYLHILEKGEKKVKVTTKVLNALALVLQADYAKLLCLAGHIKNNITIKEKTREVPILGEIRKKDANIAIFTEAIKESIAIECAFPVEKKLAGIRIKTRTKICNYNLLPSDIIIIPLSHIEAPIIDITVLKKFGD